MYYVKYITADKNDKYHMYKKRLIGMISLLFHS